MNQRIAWVDYAKGIGIVLVVYGHVTRGIFKAGIGFQDPVFKAIDSVIYSFHMPLFFFLSGLFFENSFIKNGGKKLMLHKLDTIFYPYLIWSVLQGSIEVCFSRNTNGGISFHEVFSLFSVPRGQFWFLYALFADYAMAATIYSAMGVKRGGFACVMLSAALYFFPHLMPSSPICFYISDTMVFFCFGIVYARYPDLLLFINPRIFLFSGAAFLVGQWLFHYCLSSAYSGKGLPSLALALVSIVFVAALSNEVSRIPLTFISAIGKSSKAVFLMHILSGSGARIILLDLFHVDSFWVHVVVGCAAGMLFPMIMLSLINRTKIPFVFSAPVGAGFAKVYDRIERSWRGPNA
jgi:fucose 4-O-acetylase-like acetyltransferase